MLSIARNPKTETEKMIESFESLLESMEKGEWEVCKEWVRSALKLLRGENERVDRMGKTVSRI